MKKLLSLTLTLTLAAAFLAGCSGGDKPEQKDDGADAVQEVLTGEDFTADGITVSVPDGWEAAAPEGSGGLYVIKGGSDPGSFPNMMINRNISATPPKDWYDQVTDETPIALSNYTWEGFSGLSFEYPVTVLWADQGDGSFIQISIFTDLNDLTIELDGADTRFILESIRLSD